MKWEKFGMVALLAGILSGCFELPQTGSPTDPSLQPPVVQPLSFSSGQSGDYVILGRTPAALWVKDKRDLQAKVALVKTRELTAGCQRLVSKIPLGVDLKRPFLSELTNAQGATILVNVQGRDQSSVRFTKEGDASGKSYVFPLANLSHSSRELIEALPVVDLSAIAEPSPAVRARRRALKIAEENLSRLVDQSRKPGMGGASRLKELEPQIAAATKEMQRLSHEVQALEEEERLAQLRAKKPAN